MKRLLRTLIIPALFMATLSGCNNNKQYNDLCAKAADSAPLLLNSLTGKEIYSSTHKKELADYVSVLGLKSFTYAQKEFQAKWELTPAEKWTSSNYVVDETRVKLTPNYGAEDFEASLKCTVSCLENNKAKGKAVMTWSFDVMATNTVEMTLKQINERFVENGKKLTGMDKDSEGHEISIGTRGYITGAFESPDHVYAGVFISDGEYSTQLYTGVLSDAWKENQLKVGSCVFAVGGLSLYNGFIEMKPSLIDVIDAEAYNVAAPVTIDASTKTWDGSLIINQSSLVTLSDCVYQSGNVSKNDSHASIMFKHNEDSITVYCNYHIGPTAMDAIKELVGGYTANETTVTLKGILSFYNETPQIIPVFGVNSFVAPVAQA